MEDLIYSVYAHANEHGLITKIYSTCFEAPDPEDILLRTGAGDEFVHVSGIQLLDGSGCHLFKASDDGIVRRTPEELQSELEAMPAAPTSTDERLTVLEESLELLLELI